MCQYCIQPLGCRTGPAIPSVEVTENRSPEVFLILSMVVVVFCAFLHQDVKLFKQQLESSSHCSRSIKFDLN